MNITPTALPGVVVVEPQVFSDARGHFFESWRADRFAEVGLPASFVQENQSCSVAGVVRGLHYQLRRPQGKLVRVVRGTVFDVAVDIRRGSPAFGRWVGELLSAENRRQLWIPPGFAHGFAALEGPADLVYTCTDFFDASDDRGVRWNDPTLAIDWRVASPIVSPKDAALPLLSADREDLPTFAND